MKRMIVLPLGVTMLLGFIVVPGDAQGNGCGSKRHHFRCGGGFSAGSRGGFYGAYGARSAALRQMTANLPTRTSVVTAPPGYVLQVNPNPLYSYAPYNGAYGAIPYRTGVGYSAGQSGLYVYGPRKNAGFNPYLNGAYYPAWQNYYGVSAYSYSGLSGVVSVYPAGAFPVGGGWYGGGGHHHHHGHHH